MNRVIKLILIFLALSINVQAQKKKRADKGVDTLITLREFMLVCNAYKELPLKLELELVNTTSFITSPEDTMQTRAEFYLQKKASYIHFGNVEQLVNDSMALMVSNTLRQMILYPDAQRVLLQIKAMTGMQMKDSSIAELSKKYQAQTESKGNDTTSITLVSRLPLYGTSIPKEMLELTYDSKTKTPFQVRTIRRTMIPLQPADYDALKGNTEFADKLISLEEKGNYLIKEQVSSFIYSKISHEPGINIPVTIADRITKNAAGEYIPAKGFAAYRLIIN
ncbi:MAG TPA: hypothetical protein VF487_15375 [Chitinophagaceae bacterium]